MGNKLTFAMWLVYTNGQGKRWGATRATSDIVELEGPDYTTSAIKLIEGQTDSPYPEDDMPEVEVVSHDDFGPVLFRVEHYEIAPLEKGQFFEFRRIAS